MPGKLAILLFFGSFYLSFGQKLSDDAHVITPHADNSLKFTENAGQWSDPILFRAQLDGGALFLERDGLTFSFYDKKKYRAMHLGGLAKKYRDPDLKQQAYKIKFEGCNERPSIEKLQKGSDYENFFIGNNKDNWKGFVN